MSDRFTYFAVRQRDVDLFVQSQGRAGYCSTGETIEQLAERFVTSGHADELEDTGLWRQEDGVPRPCSGDDTPEFQRAARYFAGGG